MTDTKKHVYDLGPDGNHALLIETEVHPNDGEPFLTQEITLNSVGNCASISLGMSLMTPDILRDMANSLEKFLNKEMP